MNDSLLIVTIKEEPPCREAGWRQPGLPMVDYVVSEKALDFIFSRKARKNKI